MNTINNDNDDDQTANKIRIKLISLSPEYAVTDADLAVPSDLRRKGLSKLVNYLLGYDDEEENEGDKDSDNEDDATDKPKSSQLQFDFLITSQYLRQSLSGYIRANNLSTEDVLVVEFIPRRTKPQIENDDNKALPDWISCVSYVGSGNNDTNLVSACYDGTLRITNSQNLSIVNELKCHDSPIRCLSTSTSPTFDKYYIASGGKDQQLLISTYDVNSNAFGVMYNCVNGHSNSVEAVCFDSGNNGGNGRVVSGDWDGNLCLWDFNFNGGDSETIESASVIKKRKTATSTAPTQTNLEPKSTVNLNTACISSLLWSNTSPQTIYTSSWDYSIKSFDIETQNVLLTHNASRVVSCMCKSWDSEVVATGHTDTHVKLWDMRSSTSGAAASSTKMDNTFNPSHKSWVSSVAWDKNDSYSIVSCSHDGSVKWWDVRCSIPLYTVNGHSSPKGSSEGKALAVVFGDNGEVFSGGSDCLVRRYNGGGKEKDKEKEKGDIVME